jgi:hypothetical protein
LIPKTSNIKIAFGKDVKGYILIAVALSAAVVG